MHGEAVAPRVCDPRSTHPVPLVYPQSSESLHLQAERLTGLWTHQRDKKVEKSASTISLEEKYPALYFF